MDERRQAGRLVGAARFGAALIEGMRPRQWIKNLLVFLPLLFALNEAWELEDPAGALTLFWRVAIALLNFCILSGGMYLFNDALDVDRDRAHPTKRFRPVASGRLRADVALGVGIVLTAGAVYPAFEYETLFGVVVLVYVLIQYTYSLWVKNVVLLDVFAVASGFVLRVLAGAAVLGLPISPWLYLCTGLGALFIALSKRRSELARAGESAVGQRDTLGAYTLPMLDQMIAVVATSALVSYALYTFTAGNLPDNHSMMLTIPFVVYGLFRYMQLVHSRDAGESPETIMITDVPMIVTVLLWLGTAGASLLLGR